MDRELSISENLKKGLGIIQSQGIGAFIKKLGNRLSQLSYQDWIEKYDTLTDRDIALINEQIEKFTKQPSFGFVLLPKGPDKVDFRNKEIQKTLKSLQSQFYTKWNLLIPGDSLLAETDELIQDISKIDSRIKIFGVSDATSNFDYITKIYEGDEISPHALYLVAEHLQQDSPKILYSDEDSIDLNGARSAPIFKSDWNPDLFKCRNYFGGLALFKNENNANLNEAASIVSSPETLNLADHLDKQVLHLPFVLYHKALENSVGKVEERIPTALKRAEKESLVSIVVLTRDKEFLLRKCIDSIKGKTLYSNYEIVVVDNGSTEAGSLRYLESLKAMPGTSVIRIDELFNFSRLNNLGAQAAKGELLAFVNNDIEVIAPDWLSYLVAQINQSRVGAVGARLWYPNDTLQHGGIVLGLGGIAGHPLRGLTKREECQDGFTDEIRTVSAVTAACMLTKREIFEKLGGFNENSLPVAYNDVDYCLRAQRQGFRIVYVPEAELYHHESASRRADYLGASITRYKKECEYMRKEWGDLLSSDPFFNPNLSLSGRQIQLADPPRVQRPWLNKSANSVKY